SGPHSWRGETERAQGVSPMESQCSKCVQPTDSASTTALNDRGIRFDLEGHLDSARGLLDIAWNEIEDCISDPAAKRKLVLLLEAIDSKLSLAEVTIAAVRS